MRPMTARTKGVFVTDLHDEVGEAWGGDGRGWMVVVVVVVVGQSQW